MNFILVVQIKNLIGTEMKINHILFHKPSSQGNISNIIINIQY